MTHRPLLFLDVDGVLNACPPIDGVPVTRKHGFPICIPPGTRERITRLCEVFEPVWATTWRERAHPAFAEDLGVVGKTWPHIDFTHMKLLSIMDYAITQRMSDFHVRPWVWIDDDARWEIEQVGLRPDGRKSLAIVPETAIGLTDDHVGHALEFVAALNPNASSEVPS